MEILALFGLTGTLKWMVIGGIAGGIGGTIGHFLNKNKQAKKSENP